MAKVINLAEERERRETSASSTFSRLSELVDQGYWTERDVLAFYSALNCVSSFLYWEHGTHSVDVDTLLGDVAAFMYSRGIW